MTYNLAEFGNYLDTLKKKNQLGTVEVATVGDTEDFHSINGFMRNMAITCFVRNNSLIIYNRTTAIRLCNISNIIVDDINKSIEIRCQNDLDKADESIFIIKI